MDITQRPKGPAIDISTMKVKRAPPVKTLLKHFTDDGSNGRLQFLQKMAGISKSPVWMEYLTFIQKNSSGDITTFSEQNKKYIDKMIQVIDEKQVAENSGS